MSANEAMTEYATALREMTAHNAQATLHRSPSEAEAWRRRAPEVADRVKRAKALIDGMGAVL